MLSTLCKSLCKSLAISLISLFSINIAFANYASVDDFVKDQKVIRIALDSGPGFGDQAASLNVMSWLRSHGFQGWFEVIYPDEITYKMKSLFNLPYVYISALPTTYEDTVNHVRLIKQSQFESDHDNGKVIYYPLGISGEYETDPCAYYAEGDTKVGCEINARYADPSVPYTYHNFANYFNVGNFINVGVWNFKTNMSLIYAFDQVIIKQLDVTNTYFNVPQTTLAMAKRYLSQDANGKNFLLKNPALLDLMSVIENQTVNIMSIYGLTIQNGGQGGDFIYDVMEFITAAHYAQLTGSEKFHHPLIIPVFYDYTEECKILTEVIKKDDWSHVRSTETPDTRKAILQKVIKDLNLSTTFSTANLSDPDLSQKIHHLSPYEILLVSMGPLPKVVFDGVYTYTNDNIWPQVREGESSLNSLLVTGKPNIRCSWSLWELPWDNWITDNDLKNRLHKLFGFLNNANGYAEGGLICRGNQSWESNPDLYKDLARLILDASNPDSAYSKYFQRLKIEASKPENDRINRALTEALQHTN